MVAGYISHWAIEVVLTSFEAIMTRNIMKAVVSDGEA